MITTKFYISKELNTKADVLIIGLLTDELELYKDLNPEIDIEIKNAIKKDIFSLKTGSVFQTKITHSVYKNIIVSCLGKKKELDMESVRRSISSAVNLGLTNKMRSFTTNIATLVAASKELSYEEIGIAIAEGTVLSSYSFKKYKSKKEKDQSNLSFSIQFLKKPEKLKSGLNTGQIIANATNFARDMINEPPNVATASYLEKKAKEIASSKLKVRVLKKSYIKKKKMGGLLAVSRGGGEDPRILVLEYNGGESEKTVLVGKGITFDTGGINLKPEGGLMDMKSDMGGAAAVLGIMKSVSELGIKKNISAVVPVCENVISETAYRPSDIITMYNGKTVEVLNTDAEGRMILADGLAYAEKDLKANTIIDLATLTGACMVAIGQAGSGLITADSELRADLTAAGEKSRDRTWAFPFWEEYQDKMDSDIADYQNLAGIGPSSRLGGAITAGVFLSKFVDKAKWAHIDLAGYSFIPKSFFYNPKDGTGAGVRLITYYFLELY